MDIVVELIKSVLTIGVIATIAIGMGFLFIIILSLATGIDHTIHQEREPR